MAINRCCDWRKPVDKNRQMNKVAPMNGFGTKQNRTSAHFFLAAG
jgi:hypothetical protein